MDTPLSLQKCDDVTETMPTKDNILDKVIDKFGENAKSEDHIQSEDSVESEMATKITNTVKHEDTVQSGQTAGSTESTKPGVQNPFFEGGEPNPAEFPDIFAPDHSIVPELAKVTESTDSTESTESKEAGAFLKCAEHLSTKTAIDFDDTPDGMVVELEDHQKIALRWLKNQETDPQRRGGILADEMGLGKTVEMIALMVSRFHAQSPLARARNQSSNTYSFFMPFQVGSPASKANATTLIVAPASLLRQWDMEIRTKTSPTMSTYIFEKPGRMRRIAFEVSDVVLVSYETLARDFDRSEKKQETFFFETELKFYRVILDEAHKIKNKDSTMSKACRALKAEYRWYVSGTPIHNGVFEFYPAMSFLRVVGFDSLKDFESKVVKVSHADGVKTLLPVLARYVLRRAKIDTIPLPPKEAIYTFTAFDQAQREVYDCIESEVQMEINKYRHESGREFNFRTTKVLRLRQICLHPSLMQFTAKDDLLDSPLNEQRLVRNATYNFPIEHIRRILDIVKTAEQTKTDFKCEKCSKRAVSRLIPRCGHGLCTQCYENNTPSLKKDAEYSPEGSCLVCSTSFECIFVTTLIAFKCAWLPGFRRDSWDEEEPETKQPFGQAEYLQPLLSEITGIELFAKRWRFVDPRIWGRANVALLQGHFINQPEGSSFPENFDDNLGVDGETSSHEKRKLSSLHGESDNDSETTLTNTTLAKRQCVTSPLGGQNDSLAKDEIRIKEELENRQTTPKAATSRETPEKEASLWTGQSDNDKSLSLTTSSIFKPSDGNASSAQVLFSPRQQDALMAACRISDEYLGIMMLIAADRAQNSTIKDEMDVSPVIPDFQLTVTNNEFDLPYNLARLRNEASGSIDKKNRYLARLRDLEVPECTKITKLMEVLQKKQSEFPDDRIIVFSEFTTALDFIEVRFSLDGKDDYLRYDGSMTGRQKDDVVQMFQNTENRYRVLLCGLRAGSVGLNLQVANHVIFMEPFWNPFVHDQAVDRCHRMGSEKRVYVEHLIVPRTIEERILVVQQQKRQEVTEVLAGKEVKTNVKASLARLTAKDMDFIVGIDGTGPNGLAGEQLDESETIDEDGF